MCPRVILWCLCVLLPLAAYADTGVDTNAEATSTVDKAVAASRQLDGKSLDDPALQRGIEQLDKPLYTPFVELYFLEELKQLRKTLSDTRVEVIEEVVDRELATANKAITYATDTVTYFFYLIAGVSSILVLVGWTSIRDIKDKVHTMASEEVGQIVAEYEKRLQNMEAVMAKRSEQIEENHQEIEKTNEVHSLWLRASQEVSPENKIAVYDEILALKPYDVEALTYKADQVLELEQPKWAINLCRQALEKDPEHAHAYYQLACAHACQGHVAEAVEYLSRAITRSESYGEQAVTDKAFRKIRSTDPFQAVLADMALLPS